jgi:hypothetical protein
MQDVTQTGQQGRKPGGLPYKWIVAIVVIFGVFMSVVDTTIVTIAIPRFQTAFGAGLTDVQWVLTAYTLTLGIVTPTTAFFATLSEADFRQKSIASAWTIKELLVHIVFWLRETPRVVKVVRTGRGIRSIGEYRTIETIIRSHHTHFQEHATEIWQSLSREETRGASCAHSQHLDA